jgi:hypothetical protein
MLPRRTFRRRIAPLVALVLSVGLCAANVLAQAERKPYSKEAIVGLLKGEVSPKRVAVLARQRGIDFQITPEVESELRRAGATDSLLATLRELAPTPPKPPEKPAEIVVQTSPGAEVYVDDQFAGRASPKGQLVIANPRAGGHALRVSLAGKRDYERNVTVAAGQVTEITAVLADVAGTVVVRTLPGAEVFLDSANRGRTDPSGQLSVLDVAAGSHELRVTAAGKKDFSQSVTLTPGQTTYVHALLEDTGAANAALGELFVITSPDAEVYLDGALRGRTDWLGKSVIKAEPGTYEVKVFLAGKKEFLQSVTLTPGQTTYVHALLEDMEGIGVQPTAPTKQIVSPPQMSLSKAEGSSESVTLEYPACSTVTGYSVTHGWRGHPLKKSDLNKSDNMSLYLQVLGCSVGHGTDLYYNPISYMTLLVNGQISINMQGESGNWFKAEIPMGLWVSATHIELER